MAKSVKGKTGNEKELKELKELGEIIGAIDTKEQGSDIYTDKYHGTRLDYVSSRSVVWSEVAKYLSRRIGKPLQGTVVDVGCGDADFLRFIKAKRKIAVDVYKSKRLPENVEFHKLPAWKLHEKVKDADVIFVSNLLEHFSDQELTKTAESVLKSLKPGGLFIVVGPNFRYCYKNYFDDYTHKKVFTHVSMKDFLESEGFKVVKVMSKFLPTTLKSQLPQWRILVWGYLISPFKPFAGQMLVVAKKRKSL